MLARRLFPKLLDRYILRQLLDYFVLGIVLFSLIIFFSDTLFDFVSDIRKFGLPVDTMLLIIGLQLPKSVGLVIPASCFMAVLMTYHTMNTHFELISFRMNGISLGRLVYPALMMATCGTLLTYAINDFVVPYCNAETNALKHQAIENASLPTGLTSFLHNTYDRKHNLIQSIYISRYRGGRLGDSTILDLTNPSAMRVVQAKSGFYDDEKGWQFDDANVYVVSANMKTSSAGHWGSIGFHKLLNHDAEEEKQAEMAQDKTDGNYIDPKTQSFADLFSAIQRREAQAASITGERREKYLPTRKSYLMLWEKLTLPFSCLVIVLSGVALAMSAPRQGSQWGFVLSLLVLLVWYTLYSLFNNIGKGSFLELEGLLSRGEATLIASWLPVVIMGLVGLILLQRKSRVL